MALYKDLSSLFKAIEKDMRNVMLDEVADTAIDIQQESIHDVVYNAYEPFVYDRDGDRDGLSDRDNNVVIPFTISGGVEILIQNTRRNEQGQYLTPLITGGDGAYGMEYNYKQNRDGTEWKYLQPRDFISDAIERMQRSLEHIDAFRRGMERKGYKFYK